MKEELSIAAQLSDDLKMSGMSRGADDLRFHMLQEIISNSGLTPSFQPIVDILKGSILGYEGFIRGPEESPLSSPLSLLGSARDYGRFFEVESLCRRVILEGFSARGFQGVLYLNVSPESLIDPGFKAGETRRFIDKLGIDPQRIIIELTEREPGLDHSLLLKAVKHYKSMGFKISIDDLGEGFSSFVWAEIAPDFLKIDRRFVHSIDSDPEKRKLVSSMRQFARVEACTLIAEGVETIEELRCIRDIGVTLAQGFLIAKPGPDPLAALPPSLLGALSRA